MVDLEQLAFQRPAIKTEHLGRPRRVLDRARVRQMYEAGVSLREIAAKFGIGRGTAHRIVKAAA